jgi:hypothetical protein
MARVSRKYGWLMLGIYPLFGLALGLADPALGTVVQQLGIKAGAATAISVNMLMPVAAVALGLVWARVGSAWFGAALMTLGFVIGLAIRYSTANQGWSLVGIPRSIPPVLIVAGLGYAVLGTFAALIGRGWRTWSSSNGPQAG